MKTSLIFLVLLIVCFSCGTNNKPVSDAQKEKIKGEVKEVVNTFFKSCEEGNFDKAAELFFDSPDFVYQVNGKIFTYKEFVDAAKTSFSTRKNQKCTIVDEKCAILDNSTVLYTTNLKWLTSFKDGHTILYDPWVSQLIFKKIDSKWRGYSGVESGVEQSVANAETSKELNQVECINQLVGSWKLESGKDTTVYSDFTTYGTGVDVIMKYVSKGKTFMEERINWAYNKTLNRIIGILQTKGGDNASLWAVQWISKNKYFLVGYKDISNPENASTRLEGTLKSHDLLEIIYYENNKPVKTDTWTRVK
jgi:hypothetical protein